jgi:hypothetical protein
MAIHEQVPQPGPKGHEDKHRVLIQESLNLRVRRALCARPFLRALPALKFLFYFHVEIPAKGVGRGRIKTVAFIGERWIGIENIVNTES